MLELNTMKKQISIFLLTLFALLQSVAYAQTVAPNSYVDNLGVHVVSNATQSIYPTVPLVNNVQVYTVSGAPTTDSTGASSTLYVAAPQCTFQQTAGNYQLLTMPQTSVTMSGLTVNGDYDIYVKDINGTVTVTLSSAWANDTTPPTRGVDSYGRPTKNGDTASLLFGAFKAVSATTTVDNVASRWVANALNRRPKDMIGTTAGTVWTSSTTTQTPADANTTDGQFRCSFLTAVPAESSNFDSCVYGAPISTISATMHWGLALDNVTTMNVISQYAGVVAANCFVSLIVSQPIGYHYVQAMNFETTNSISYSYGGQVGWIHGKVWN